MGNTCKEFGATPEYELVSSRAATQPGAMPTEMGKYDFKKVVRNILLFYFLFLKQIKVDDNSNDVDFYGKGSNYENVKHRIMKRKSSLRKLNQDNQYKNGNIDVIIPCPEE